MKFYKRRILRKLSELTVKHEKIEAEIKGLSRSLNPNIYSKLWVAKKDLEDKIELLKSLL